MPDSAKKIPRWIPLRVAEVSWDRWGLGIEFSFSHWVPPEFSVYLTIGPVLLGIGVEENWEWSYPPDRPVAAPGPPSYPKPQSKDFA